MDPTLGGTRFMRSNSTYVFAFDAFLLVSLSSTVASSVAAQSGTLGGVASGLLELQSRTFHTAFAASMVARGHLGGDHCKRVLRLQQ